MPADGSGTQHLDTKLVELLFAGTARQENPVPLKHCRPPKAQGDGLRCGHPQPRINFRG
jgi:hypothetical protein